jgi:hypothetical protein
VYFTPWNSILFPLVRACTNIEVRVAFAFELGIACNS